MIRSDKNVNLSSTLALVRAAKRYSALTLIDASVSLHEAAIKHLCRAAEHYVKTKPKKRKRSK